MIEHWSILLWALSRPRVSLFLPSLYLSAGPRASPGKSGLCHRSLKPRCVPVQFPLAVPRRINSVRSWRWPLKKNKKSQSHLHMDSSLIAFLRIAFSMKKSVDRFVSEEFHRGSYAKNFYGWENSVEISLEMFFMIMLRNFCGSWGFNDRNLPENSLWKIANLN